MSKQQQWTVYALIVGRDEPESEASWEPWCSPRDAPEALEPYIRFLSDAKRRAHGGGPQAPTRVIDFDVLTRTVTTSKWRKWQIDGQTELIPDPRTTTEVPF